MERTIGPLLVDRTDRFLGYVWRGHGRRYDALDDGGSRRSTGRLHRGPNRFPLEETWPAIYTSLELAVSLAEIMRSTIASAPRHLRFTEIEVDLQSVVDCRAFDVLGLDRGRFLDDWDYSTGHALTMAVRRTGAEAMLVPSASGLGDNLVLFPDLLRTGSSMRVVRSVDPNLTKDGEWPT